VPVLQALLLRHMRCNRQAVVLPAARNAACNRPHAGAVQRRGESLPAGRVVWQRDMPPAEGEVCAEGRRGASAQAGVQAG